MIQEIKRSIKTSDIRLKTHETREFISPYDYALMHLNILDIKHKKRKELIAQKLKKIKEYLHHQSVSIKGEIKHA